MKQQKTSPKVKVVLSSNSAIWKNFINHVESGLNAHPLYYGRWASDSELEQELTKHSAILAKSKTRTKINLKFLNEAAYVAFLLRYS